MRAGDDLDAALGEEAVLRRIDLGRVGRDRDTRFKPSFSQAVKMLCVALVPGQPAMSRISSRRCASNAWPCTMLDGGAAIRDRMRAAGRQLPDRAHPVR